MMKERDIRTFMPFFIVFVSTFFLSGADLFERFIPLSTQSHGNDKLQILIIGGDVFQALIWFPCSLIFFMAWRKVRKKNLWFTDLLWQLAGVFLCFLMLSLIRIWGWFQMYLWVQGMVRVFVAIFGLYFFNTLYAARKLLFDPPTPEETIQKAKKFDELINLINGTPDRSGK